MGDRESAKGRKREMWKTKESDRLAARASWCFLLSCFRSFAFSRSIGGTLVASLPFWQSRAACLWGRFREMRPAPAKIGRWGASSIRSLSRVYTTLYGRSPSDHLRILRTEGLGRISQRPGRTPAISCYVNSSTQEIAHFVPIEASLSVCGHSKPDGGLIF